MSRQLSSTTELILAVTRGLIRYVSRHHVRLQHSKHHDLQTAVYVGETLCGKIDFIEGKSKYMVNCGGAMGNSVYVAQSGQYMNLCEVEILSK